MSEDVVEEKGFVAMVLKFFKGDEDKKIATKNKRMASSAIAAQLAVLNGQEVTQENALETAQESYEKVVYPTTLITNQEAYLTDVRQAAKFVEEAESDLEETKESMKFLSNLQKDF